MEHLSQPDLRDTDGLIDLVAEELSETPLKFFTRLDNEATELNRDPVVYAVWKITDRQEALKWKAGKVDWIQAEAGDDQLNREALLDLVQQDIDYVIGLQSHGPHTKEIRRYYSQIWDEPIHITTLAS
jgi:hypothetical protein